MIVMNGCLQRRHFPYGHLPSVRHIAGGVSSGRRKLATVKMRGKGRQVDAFTTSKQVESAPTPRQIDLWSMDVWIPFLCCIGFSATVFLVFDAAPTNFLLTIDHDVQQWVVSHIPYSVRSAFFGGIISNLSIEFDLVMGNVLILIHFLGNTKRGIVLLGLSILFLYGGVGSHVQGGFLVDALKEHFARLRPIDGASSYAFPSGHEMSAVFLTGALMFVVLPVTLRHLNTSTPPSLHRALKAFDSTVGNKTLFVGIGAGCTAVGRVGANVHWVSDTVAGCFVGVALIFLFKTVHDFADNRML